MCWGEGDEKAVGVHVRIDMWMVFFIRQESSGMDSFGVFACPLKLGAQ